LQAGMGLRLKYRFPTLQTQRPDTDRKAAQARCAKKGMKNEREPSSRRAFRYHAQASLMN